MIFSIKKFDKEIRGLRESGNSGLLGAEAKLRIKQSVLHSIAELPQDSAPAPRTARLLFAMRYALAVLAGIAIVGGTAFAASSSVPGDPLFPVKKAAEAVQLRLAGSEQAKAELQVKFAQERINELSQITTELESQPTSMPASEKKLRAKAEAEQQAGDALSHLHQVQNDFEAKGNTTTAESLNQAIIKMQDGLRMNRQDNSRRENRGRLQQSGGSLPNTLFEDAASSTATATMPFFQIENDSMQNRSGMRQQNRGQSERRSGWPQNKNNSATSTPEGD